MPESGPWWLAVFVPEGQRYPRGYGHAWFEPWSPASIAAPVPLNWIYSWFRVCWYFLVRGRTPGKIEQQIHDAYYRGRNEKTDEMYAKYHYTHAQLRAAYHQGRKHMTAWYLVELEIEAAKRRKQQGENNG